MVKLTTHGKLRISERNIKLSDVLLVIERPSMVFYDTMTGCNVAWHLGKVSLTNGFLYRMF